jgi:peptidoglycan/LPS O-acetylase OafA/YrhL
MSGLSMAIVYSGFIVDKKTTLIFYVRRIFRIWPLLWMCVALATILALLAGNQVSIVKILLNITTIFGFTSPGSYINTGAWSIGNEMVYYALTPILLITYDKSKVKGNALLFLSLLVAILFAFVLLDSQKPLAEQWGTYINPFNNIFLYVAGIAIYYNLKSVDITRPTLVILFCVSIAIFLFYPVAGNQVEIITGVNRVVFLLASITLVYVFYKFPYYSFIPRSVQYPLGQLGLATYGIYMLHPVVYNYTGYTFNKLGLQNIPVLFAVTVILTVILAITSFNTFEKRIMKHGKRVTSNGSNLWKMFERVQ